MATARPHPKISKVLPPPGHSCPMRSSTTLLPILLPALLAAACTSAPTEPLGGRITSSVGPDGAVLQSSDGALALSIASGALDEATDVTIDVDRTLPGFPTPIYRLGPSSATLRTPVDLRITVPAGAAGPFTLARLDGTTAVKVAGSTWDATTRRVSGSLTALTSVVVVPADATSPGPCASNNTGPGPTPPGNDGGIAKDSTWTFCPLDEVEPNDTFATAQPTGLVLDTGVELDNTWDGTADTFSFTVPSGAHANLIAETFDENTDCPTSTDLDLEARLLDASGNVLVSRTHGFFRCGAVDFEATPEAARLPGGTYHVQILQDGAAPIGRKYKLRVWLIGVP